MLLAPGAINYGDGAQRAIRFAGHSLDDSNFTFDGVDTSGVQEQTQKADTRLNIALDAISEFRVSTSNYTAEIGSRRRSAESMWCPRAEQTNFTAALSMRFATTRWTRALRLTALSYLPSRCTNSAAASAARSSKTKRSSTPTMRVCVRTSGSTFTNFVPNAAFRAKVLAKSPVLKPILDAYPTGADAD